MSESDKPKVQRDRSPSFPFIPLQTAIDRLVSLDEYFKRHPARAEKAGLAWNLKEKSSQAYQTLAAMKSFGLIEYQGTGKDRAAIVSDDGRTYLRAQQDAVKHEVLKKCALKPKLINKYWHIWGDDRPADPVCLDELVLKGSFTESAASNFLKVYDSTIAYAKLGKSDKIGGNGNGDTPPEIEVNDLIQWESSGVLQFPEPKKVRAIQEHEGQSWVFVDDSETGVLMSEAILEQKGSSGVPNSTPPTPPVMPIQNREIKTSENEREWLRGPLSRDIGYRLIVSGDIGPKEIGKLIKLLEAQKEVLSDLDGDEENQY